MSLSTPRRLSAARPAPSQPPSRPNLFLVREPPPSLREELCRLFLANRRRLIAGLIRQGFRPAEAEDLCAEAFVIALRKLPSFHGNSSLRTWLWGIARKLASDQRRSARARFEVLVDNEPERVQDEDPFVLFERWQELCALQGALRGLKAGPKAVVSRFALDEVPMSAVAREQGLPLQTAYARLYAAQKALRRALEAGREEERAEGRRQSSRLRE